MVSVSKNPNLNEFDELTLAYQATTDGHAADLFRQVSESASRNKEEIVKVTLSYEEASDE